jgi:trigger factor
MQVTVTKLSPVLVELDVALPADRVKAELDKAYQQIGKTAKVPGFRPGKAPRHVLAHLFGPRVAADVARRLMDDSFPRALSEQKLQPVTQPAVELGRLSDGQPFSYKARVEVIPEIAAVSYEGLQARRAKLEVTPERLGEELEKLRRQHSTLEPPKVDRGASKGDVLVVDFTVEVDGESVPDAGQQDFSIEIGASSVFAKIEEALDGKRAGESAEAEVEMPPQHPNERLAGKRALFRLSVKDVKERVLPDLDDEFAKDVGEHDTLDALKAALGEQIKKQLEEQVQNQIAEQLVAELVKANPIPVPPSLVAQQARVTEQQVVMQARRQGLQASGVGDELRARIQADSETKVRAGLLMAEIAKKEGLAIGEPDIEKGLVELAEQTGKNVNKLRAEYRDKKKRDLLIGMILENKVLDIIESRAKIEDGAGA